ncbi:MAG: response regulator [bacterium]|nr:response regulator [bacterium]
MKLKVISKTSLFIVFFLAFLVIGFIPFAFVKYYTLGKVENELRSSLNETYYLLTENIVDMLDQVYIQHWISNLIRLSASLDHKVIYENPVRNALLNTFFQNTDDMLTLSLIPPDSTQPLHFLKQDRLRDLSQQDPEGVASLFTIHDADAISNGEGPLIYPPILLKGGHDIFLPVDVFINWDDRQKARIHCIYELTRSLHLLEQELPIGSKEMYIVDHVGTIIFSNKRGHFSEGEQLKFPIMGKIRKSLAGKARTFQLEIFNYQEDSYVGNFSTTRAVNWAVVVVEPYNSAYALVQQTKRQIFFWAMAAIFLCSACAAFFSWFFSLFIVNVEQALLKAKEAADDARKSAESANRAKSEFLANMSHEIRTPMNAVMGFTSILEEKINDEHLQRYLALIRAGGKSLLTLINDILDLSKIEAGKFRFEYEAVSLRLVVKEVTEIFSHKAEEKRIELMNEIAPDLPEYLLLDEIRLRQILLNLIGNAVKFTHSGYVKISASTQHTEESSHTVKMLVTVEDTGIGIPDEQKELIFEAFEQQKGQNYSKYGGTGLGLAITKRLINAMGGAIFVSAEEGKGSIFTMSLSNVAVVKIPRDKALNAEAGVDTIRFDAARILVADDIRNNRMLIRELLEDADFHFLEAENGAVAFELAQQQHPDLILMDIKMPVKDGREATRMLKADTATQDIPVIAVTADAIPETEKELRFLCDGYIRKPVTKVELISELTRFLKHSFEDPAREAVEDAQPPGEEAALSETVAPEILERFPELIHILENSFMPQWEEISDLLIMEDVKQFSTDLNHLAREYQLQPLIGYSDRLYQHVISYDVPGVMKQMRTFPRIFEWVQNLSLNNLQPRSHEGTKKEEVETLST